MPNIVDIENVDIPNKDLEEVKIRNKLNTVVRKDQFAKKNSFEAFQEEQALRKDLALKLKNNSVEGLGFCLTKNSDLSKKTARKHAKIACDYLDKYGRLPRRRENGPTYFYCYEIKRGSYSLEAIEEFKKEAADLGYPGYFDTKDNTRKPKSESNPKNQTFLNETLARKMIEFLVLNERLPRVSSKHKIEKKIYRIYHRLESNLNNAKYKKVIERVKELSKEYGLKDFLEKDFLERYRLLSNLQVIVSFYLKKGYLPIRSVNSRGLIVSSSSFEGNLDSQLSSILEAKRKCAIPRSSLICLEKYVESMGVKEVLSLTLDKRRKRTIQLCKDLYRTGGVVADLLKKGNIDSYKYAKSIKSALEGRSDAAISEDTIEIIRRFGMTDILLSGSAKDPISKKGNVEELLSFIKEKGRIPNYKDYDEKKLYHRLARLRTARKGKSDYKFKRSFDLLAKNYGLPDIFK